jgi:hypothetical protein
MKQLSRSCQFSEGRRLKAIAKYKKLTGDLCDRSLVLWVNCDRDEFIGD